MMRIVWVLPWSLFCLAVLVLSACSGGSSGASGDDGTPSPPYTVTATAAQGGSISPSTQSVIQGSSATFDLLPDEGYSIASVSGCEGTLDGNVYTTGPISGTCTVTANFTIMSYSITATAGTGGSISPSTKMVTYGDNVTFSVTPNSGYSIKSIIGCNGTLNGTSYTSGLITSNCAVTANFTTSASSDLFNISTFASPTNGGNVTGGGAYSGGMSVTVSATAEAGYNFVNWTEGGSPVASSSDYIFNADTARTLVANFEPNTYSVSAIATTGGTIDPANSTVVYGGSTTFTVTPDAGYSIGSVSGCYGSLQDRTYTTGTISDTCSVTATFVQNSYVITATSASGGSITPSIKTVAEGDVVSFTLTPDTGYIIQEVSGCNGTLDGYIYTTGVISSDCSVTVSYVLAPVLKFDEGSFDKNTLG